MKSLIVLLAVVLAGLPAFAQQGDWDGVTSALGRKGAEQGGVYKITFPRTDLAVTKAGVPVLPGVALTSWVGFAGHPGQAMAMGDLVLLEQEVKPAMEAFFKAGVEVTALHNHLLGTIPNVLYLHFSAMGDAAQVARALRQALAATATPLGEAQAAGSPAEAAGWAAVEAVLGPAGRKTNDLVQFSFPRKETIRENGMDVPPALGVATALSMARVGDKAETSGDFVLLADEVNPVAKALLQGGLEVTAVHGHMLRESPRLFFMHFWGSGNPESLAKGLKAALEAAHFP